MMVEPTGIRLVPLIKEVWKRSSLSTWKGNNNNKKLAVCKTGSDPSLGTKSAGTFTLDFLVFRTVKNRFLLFKQPSVLKGRLVAKNLPANEGTQEIKSLIPGREDLLEEEMATHSSILAWRILWTEEQELDMT